MIISLAIIALNLVGYAAVTAGFIPAIASGIVVVPPEAGITLLPAWVTPLTTTLIHGGFAHLALNMVMFFYCAAQTERALGWKAILILYLVGAYAAALGQWVQDPSSAIPMIGASGAISAVVAAYALLFGTRSARAIGPLPARLVHALWLGAAWIGIQLLIGFSGLGGGGLSPSSGGGAIAVAAHIGGFLAGLVLTRPLLLWRYRGA